MLRKHFTDVAEGAVTLAGSSGVTIRWLIAEADGAQRFAMRRFEIAPKGRIGLHSHPEEHEIYVLSGTARVYNGSGVETAAGPGDVLFVPPHEAHGYDNVGDDAFTFLCVVPLNVDG
jgi:quercetin dioxygenase-like cupin family protein